jgi:hypothetical protein
MNNSKALRDNRSIPLVGLASNKIDFIFFHKTLFCIFDLHFLNDIQKIFESITFHENF